MRMRKLILIVDTGLEFAQIDKVRRGDYYYYSFLRVESWRFSLKYIIIMLLGCYCFIKRMQSNVLNYMMTGRKSFELG